MQGDPQPLLGHPRIRCPKWVPLTSFCVQSSASHSSLFCPPSLPGQGSPCCSLFLSMQQCHRCDSRKHRIPVVPGPASSSFCPLVLCTHSPTCPQMLGCNKSMFAVTLEKMEFLQSGAATPRLAAVPLTVPPFYPWPTNGAVHLQSLYLVFLWWVVRGQHP